MKKELLVIIYRDCNFKISFYDFYPFHQTFFYQLYFYYKCYPTLMNHLDFNKNK